jgi:hypothetical protein
MDKKTSVDSLVLKPKVAFLLWRERRSLTAGLRRLTRWQNRLRTLLAVLRVELDNPGLPPAPMLMKLLGLYQPLPLRQTTLLWALTLLEDLYLLVETLELETRRELSKMSPRS